MGNILQNDELLKKLQKAPQKADVTPTEEFSLMEKIGIGALITTASIGTLMVLFPGATKAFLGGGLTSLGGKLIVDSYRGK